jgi:hypothetical protein
LPAIGATTATITSATDWPVPMNVLDQPSVFVQSSVMIETIWRADITKERTAKHSQTTTQGLRRRSLSSVGDKV